VLAGKASHDIIRKVEKSPGRTKKEEGHREENFSCLIDSFWVVAFHQLVVEVG
jgi:hypothetical protein